MIAANAAEIACILTAIANVFCVAYFAGKISQLVRDTARRVDSLEAWRDRMLP
jgi:hypothetical protein